MKNFIKTMDQTSDGFKHLKVKLDDVQSDAKLKAGIFDGPQIRDLMKDQDFPSKLKPVGLRAWKAFIYVSFIHAHQMA